MRSWLTASGLVALVLTAGCLGGVDAAEIPDQTLSQEGWELKSEERDSVVLGMGEKVSREYGKRGGVAGVMGVMVVTVNDVPLVDEKKFIPGALEEVEKSQGIQFEETGTTQLSLTNLDTTVSATEYRVTKDNLNGDAVLFTPNCGSFVVVVGYGASGAGGVGFGGESNFSQEAQRVARTVAC